MSRPSRPPSWPDVDFDADPGPGCFSAVFRSDPTANTGSLNAGDYRLYVGGGAINGAFRDALAAAGHVLETQPERSGDEEPGPPPNLAGFGELHRSLLTAARDSPGRLFWITSQQLEDASCGAGLIGFCGLVPPPGSAARATRLLPVGLVSIAIFALGKRPGHIRNVAMVYTVGPNCGKKKKKDQRSCEKTMCCADFLEIIQQIGSSIMSAALQYNAAVLQAREASSGDASSAGAPPARPVDGTLPLLELLRICLVSGGVYKHPEATKVQVATAIIRGLLSAYSGDERREGGATGRVGLEFTYDDDVFKEAWQQCTSATASQGGRGKSDGHPIGSGIAAVMAEQKEEHHE